MPRGLAGLSQGKKLQLGQMRRPAGILQRLPDAAVDFSVLNGRRQSRAGGKTKREHSGDDATDPAYDHRKNLLESSSYKHGSRCDSQAELIA